MMRTECDTVRDALPDYSSEATPAGIRTAVDAHLAVCADCRADLEIVEFLTRSAERAPTGLHERVVSAVHARKAPARWPYAAAALAAASIVALLGARAMLERTAPVAEPLATVATPAGAQPVRMPVQSSPAPQRVPAGTEARSLMQPFPGSSIAAAADATTLNDLSEEQLRSLIAELES